MNSRSEELNYILNVLISLKQYPDHNIAVLDDQINKIKFLIERS